MKIDSRFVILCFNTPKNLKNLGKKKTILIKTRKINRFYILKDPDSHYGVWFTATVPKRTNQNKSENDWFEMLKEKKKQRRSGTGAV